MIPSFKIMLALTLLAGAVGCQSPRDAKTSTAEGLTLAARDWGKGRISFEAHNSGPEPVYFQEYGEMPLFSNLLARNARGNKVPYTSRGEARFVDPVYYSIQHGTLHPGDRRIWNFKLKDFARVHWGIYSVDLDLYVTRAQGSYDAENGEIIEFRDLKVRIP